MEATPTLFGLLVGFLVGLTGVGGGSLMTPFLVTVVGVSAPTAVGTDMVFATLTKLTGSVQHYRQRSVNLEVALFLGLGSIPARPRSTLPLSRWAKPVTSERTVACAISVPTTIAGASG